MCQTTPNRYAKTMNAKRMRRAGGLRGAAPDGIVLLCICGSAVAAEPASQSAGLRDELKAYQCKIVYETYRDNNWELFLMNADGSNPMNLTRTPDMDELYAKASPDGGKICFVADEGKGKAKVRSVYLMNVDGTDQRMIAHKARWPCWGHDGKTIAYLKGRPGPFTRSHNATRGLVYYDLATGQHTPHVNAAVAKVLCISWSPDGKWFVATAAGGMGYGFSIIAFEAAGTRHFELVGSTKGAWQCRPDFSPDGKQIAYAKATGTGPSDKIFAIATGRVDLTAAEPKLTHQRDVVTAGWPTELYHADWSPDGKYLVYSRGPREMSKMKPQRAIISIEAPGWDICVADAAGREKWVAVTTDGLSNKEPDWVWAR